MKSARHQLILLGLICQGFTWDDFLLPGLYLLAWLGALILPRKPIRLGAIVEGLLLVGGAALTWVLGQQLGANTHFFLGHGLAWIQLARLLRPLNRQEMFFSVLIALFHLAVGCTFLFDYRFIPVLIATVYLVPRTLLELEFSAAQATAAVGFSGDIQDHSPSHPSSFDSNAARLQRAGDYHLHVMESSPRISAPVYGVLVGFMILFFLFFPRIYLGTGLSLPSIRGSSDPSLLDSVLDLTAGSTFNSRRILFQVQGEHLGYLRCHVLTEFDGQRWTEDPHKWDPVRWSKPLGEAPGLHRRVRVKNIGSLGHSIPVDGVVTELHGTFFRQIRPTAHGTLETSVIWNAADKVYEYSIHPSPPPELLPPARRTQLTRYPTPSVGLREWLKQLQLEDQDPYAKAKRLQSFFLTHFVYELGAPRLNRLNPIDDFLFNQKRGHCERFASALALLLRMEGIPSRVVVGYLPLSRNWITGDYDIRLCDAHAWTEAWFPERGWTLMDATPAATLPPPSVWLDWLEAMDFAWYSYVVNFDTSTQNAFFEGAVGLAGSVLSWPARHYGWVLAVIIAALIWLILGRIVWPKMVLGQTDRRQPRDQIRAEHFYGQMLRVLAKHGLAKPPPQTPHEFLYAIVHRWPTLAAEAEAITQLFCAVYYGSRPLTPADRQHVRQALAKIAADCSRSPVSPGSIN
jgi:hypothetical protein